MKNPTNIYGYVISRSRRKMAEIFYGEYFAHFNDIGPVDTEMVNKRISDAERIHFICLGNICRSPFAERFAQLEFKRAGMEEMTITSSGLSTKQGRQSPPEAINAADRFGVDLSSHTAQSTTSTELERSDIIFLMDAPNYDSFKRRFPAYLDKVFFLGVLTDNNQFTIADPFGSDIKTFEHTYEKISRSVRKLAAQATS